MNRESTTLGACMHRQKLERNAHSHSQSRGRRAGGIEPLGRQAPKDLKSSPLAREAQLGETFKHGSVDILGVSFAVCAFTGCGLSFLLHV